MRYRTKDAPGRPQLQVRVLVPPQWMSLTQFDARGDLSAVVPGLRHWNLAAMQAAGDLVSRPVDPGPRARPTSGSPVMVVQYRSASPGTQLVIGGDSHMAAYFTFARQAGIVLSTPELPIVTWNAAFGANRSDTFWPCLDAAIERGHPSVCVIEGVNGNDSLRLQDIETYQDRIRESAARVAQQGGIPVIVKAMPLHLFGKPQLAAWKQANQQLDHLVPGALLFDPAPHVEDPSRPGNWRGETTTDGLHPNVAGSVQLRRPFEDMLRNLL